MFYESFSENQITINIIYLNSSDCVAMSHIIETNSIPGKIPGNSGMVYSV